jgi:hypothetical protein
VITGPYTALEHSGVGFVVRGDPESIDELLTCAAELGQPAGLMTDSGLFYVDSDVDWVLTEIYREDGAG